MKYNFHTVFSALLLLVSCSSGYANFWKFRENKGQLHPEILYMTDVPGGHLLVRKNKLTYIFYEEDFLNKRASHPHSITKNSSSLQNETPRRLKGHVIDIDFIGANIKSAAKGMNAYPEVYNYFLGNDSSRFASGVAAFSQLIIEDIYQGIDLVFYDNNGVPEYDFRLKPGAKFSDIKMQYSGAESLWIDKGNLHCKTSVNRMVETLPVAWQQSESSEKEYVKCNFKLKNNLLTFDVSKKADLTKPLTIDPRLVFSTYSGVQHDNWGNSATFDAAGNTYSAGTVLDVLPGYVGAYDPWTGALPITPGAFDITYNGGSTDIAILKFDATGSQLLYATYVGGRDTEVPSAILVNNINELIVVGATSSENFPTTPGAYDSIFDGGPSVYPWEYYGQDWQYLNFNSGSDLFVLKLNETGSNLVASTFVGGTLNDGIIYNPFDSLDVLCANYGDQMRADIDVDREGNIIVTSNTQSPDFPVTAGAFQTTYAGGLHDAVVFKMSSDLNNMIFSTYYGSPGSDAAYSLELDSAENIVFGGGTTGPLDFGAGNSLQSMFSGEVDGYVAKLSADGATMLAGTYLATPQYDQVYFVDIDANQNIYALGQTMGFYPNTDVKFSNPNSGQFIHKLSPGLDSTYYSFTFGSGDSATTEVRPNISPTAFLVSECENLFVSGWGGVVNNGFAAAGNTFNMPVTPNATQAVTDGSDFYLMSVLKDADSLIYGTYIGALGVGDHVDGGTSRFDKRGIVYHAVCSCVDDSQFPTTPNAWSRINGSYLANSATQCNNAVFKYDLSTLRADFDIYDRPGGVIVDAGCAPASVVLSNTGEGGVIWSWQIADSLISVEEDSVEITFPVAGTYVIKHYATDITTCVRIDSMIKEFVVYEPGVIFPNDTSLCYGDSVLVTVKTPAAYTINWSPEDYAFLSVGTNSAYVFPIVDTVYHINAFNPGCAYEDSFRVKVIPVVDADFTVHLAGDTAQAAAGCLPAAILLKNQSFYGKEFYWRVDGTAISQQQDSVEATLSERGEYRLTLWSVDSLSCNISDSLSKPFRVLKPNPVFPPDTTLCIGDTLLTAVGNVASFETVSWQISGTEISTSVSDKFLFLQDTSLKVVVTDSLGCTADSAFRIHYLLYIKADFTITDPDAGDVEIESKCLPGNVSLNDKSENAKFYRWYLDDSLISEAIGPVPVVPGKKGVYEFKLTVIDSLTCNKQDTKVKDFIISRPVMQLPPDTSLCINLTLPVTVMSSSRNDKITWNPAAGISNPSSFDVSVSHPFAPRYEVTVTDSNGCDTVAYWHVAPIVRNPTAVLTAENVDAPGVVPVVGCTPLKVKFYNKSTDYDRLEFNTGNNDVWENELRDSTYLYQLHGDFIAKLIVYDTVCHQSSVASVPVKAGRSEVIFPADTGICYGDSLQLKVITGSSNTVTWFPDWLISDPTSAGPYLYYGVARDYYVYVTDSFNCYYLDTIHVVPYPRLPLIDDTTIFCKRDDGMAELKAAPGFVSYNWAPGSSSGNSFTVADTGTYFVSAVDARGCTHADTVKVLDVCPPKIFVPSVFTPNADGFNDLFEIFGSYILSFELKIFNRWGEMIYYTKDLDEMWDGTYKGKDVSIGVYTWVITYGGNEKQGFVNRTIRGDVSVLR